MGFIAVIDVGAGSVGADARQALDAAVWGARWVRVVAVNEGKSSSMQGWALDDEDRGARLFIAGGDRFQADSAIRACAAAQTLALGLLTPFALRQRTN